jgi:2-C-methyl-D-erythritol 2,4-cyclodiphosphate synthase
MMRVGQGYDAHGWAEDDRPLVMGGVHFPEHRGLAGHSDADVVTHAVIDAILGAAGLGDIGQVFPDTGEELFGANSIEMLRQVSAMTDGQSRMLTAR